LQLEPEENGKEPSKKKNEVDELMEEIE